MVASTEETAKPENSKKGAGQTKKTEAKKPEGHIFTIELRRGPIANWLTQRLERYGDRYLVEILGRAYQNDPTRVTGGTALEGDGWGE